MQAPAANDGPDDRRRSLRSCDSPQLWATIDVCNPPDQPDTVGIRGSMPGDDTAKDDDVHALSPAVPGQLAPSTGSIWPTARIRASSPSARPSPRARPGSAFSSTPVAGKPAFMLRGVVSFQWRRGSTVEYAISRPTTARHQSLAGADPAGFSAADCSVP